MAYNRKLLYTKSFPSWDTPGGNLGDLLQEGNAITPVQLTATEINEPGSTITYAVTTGALPTGLTLSSSGEISGIVNGYSQGETVNFTITATDDEGETAERNFYFTIATPYEINYLLVAGGGGGGADDGGNNEPGGGGAGGYITSWAGDGSELSGGNTTPVQPITVNSATVFSIVVGGGGGVGVSGQNSSISASTISTIEAIGGGYGANSNNNGGQAADGGSGGGAPGYIFSKYGNGTAGQGFRGGTYHASGPNPGGGGGAGQAGKASNNPSGATAAGGNGLTSTITGAAIARAGGGGGGGSYASSGSPGGIGGGGNGANGTYSPYYPATSGASNTGSGGGSGSFQSSRQPSAPGGSGVAILRMPTAKYSGNTTGSPTVTTDGSDTILTYTGSGTYTG